MTTGTRQEDLAAAVRQREVDAEKKRLARAAYDAVREYFFETDDDHDVVALAMDVLRTEASK